MKTEYDPSAVPVYLYTHWGGTELAARVGQAIAKEWRWDDPSYLARIIFDQMVEGYHGEETGYGIDTFLHWDIEHPLIEVDPSSHVVRFFLHGAEQVGGGVPFADIVKSGLHYPSI